MSLLLTTVGAIALCSLVGALVGFTFKSISPLVEDALCSTAAGVMLCAAVLGLVAPSLEFAGKNALWLPSVGIFCGAGFLLAINRAAPALCQRLGMSENDNERALIFVAAIAIHHFPEGIAAGVSFGTGDVSDAVTVSSGIAFQNVPEAMIIIPPLLKSGCTRTRCALFAFVSTAVEILGVLFGYFAVTLSLAILPFALAFAAGTMLYVIIDDLVPQTHRGKNCTMSTFAALLGFCLMLAASALTK